MGLGLKEEDARLRGHDDGCAAYHWDLKEEDSRFRGNDGWAAGMTGFWMMNFNKMRTGN